MDDEGAAAALRGQVERKGLGAALRADDRLAQRVQPFAIQPSRGGPWAHPAKLVEITHTAIDPEPAPEAPARFDPPVAPHDPRQIGPSPTQSPHPFDVPRYKRSPV